MLKNPVLFVSFILLTLSELFAQITPAFESLNSFPKIRDLSLSENQKEAYFTVQSPMEEVSIIATSTIKDGVWSKPVPVPFSTGKFKDLEPFLSPDGLSLYFASNRPLSEENQTTKDFDIWYVTRTSPQSSWSSPKNIGTTINTVHNEFYPAVSKQGNLYFTSDNPTGAGKDDIYCSLLKNGQYQKPYALSTAINSAGYEFNAFIAPDESYLLFTCYKRQDGIGSGDLYISFKQKDSSWSKAQNLGKEINSTAMDYCPFVDQNGTLYFTSKRSKILKKNHVQTSHDLEKLVNQYENGLSRLYKLPFSDLLKQFSSNASR